MRYAGLIKNDFSASPGVAVSFYTQGCPHKCEGCHNPETWDFNGGLEFNSQLLDEIVEALTANEIKRSLCILGGEPLCPENEFLTYLVIRHIKDHLPDTEIYIWTGYTYDELKNENRLRVNQILNLTTCLIDGPYIHTERDITLPMRGSRNQRIIYLDKKEK